MRNLLKENGGYMNKTMQSIKIFKTNNNKRFWFWFGFVYAIKRHFQQCFIGAFSFIRPEETGVPGKILKITCTELND